MLRNGLSALTGVIAAVMLTMVLKFVAHAMFPPSNEILEATRKIYDTRPAVIEEARDVFARKLVGLIISTRASPRRCHPLFDVSAMRDFHDPRRAEQFTK